MAMSDATSGPTDWAQLFQQTLGPTTTPMFGRVSDSTVVTTTSSASPTTAGAPGGAAAHTSIEGRVGKSARRRSRASRRAPTTLLNTDAANFRAMVQQFTGVPSGHYSNGYLPGGSPVISFGVGLNEQAPQGAAPPFRYQTQQFQQYYQPPQPQQQQQQQYSGSILSVGNNSSGNDGFLQGFSGNPRDEEFFMDAVSGQLMPRPADGYDL